MTSVNLGDNSITHAGAEALATMLKVFLLFLLFVYFFSCFSEHSALFSEHSGNPSSLIVLFVQVNNTVTDLDLRYNKVGDAGTIALSEALKVSFVFFRERSSFSGLPRPR